MHDLEFYPGPDYDPYQDMLDDLDRMKYQLVKTLWLPQVNIPVYKSPVFKIVGA